MSNHKFRPSSRLLSTIGKDLIKDDCAAIIELVKNAYDADAKKVDITFSTFFRNGEECLKLVVEDDGHGMSFDTVVSKWMVPATSDKIDRRKSPRGRPMQGSKGIGRYAASVLGEQLLLTSVDEDGNETSLAIDWTDFDRVTFLEEVEIDIQTKKSKNSSGTRIEIEGGPHKLNSWTPYQIDIMSKELSKLLLPINAGNKEPNGDVFNVRLIFRDFPTIDKDGNETVGERKNGQKMVEPFPLLDLYDYRLYGTVSSKGLAELIYENSVGDKRSEELIEKDYNISEECRFGDIDIDIRVFDRDPEAISNLISKAHSRNTALWSEGKNEMKSLLNNICGISIYRGNFRIRPYGDPEYDWLEMDKSRVQNPSMRIGVNQVAGFVIIQPEDKSDLIERSSRDGLKDSKNYREFKRIVHESIGELESRRFKFRRTSGRIPTMKGPVASIVKEVFDFKGLKSVVEKELATSGVLESSRRKIIEYINRDEENRLQAVKRIEDIIALYQGQATLGKIIMVLMHEGRKPVSWFKNAAIIMDRQIQKVEKGDNEQLVLLRETINTAAEQANLLSLLFAKLDPLAVRRRSNSWFSIKDQIRKAVNVYDHELNSHDITVDLYCEDDPRIFGWKQDFVVAISNLIDNSIYWISSAKTTERKIRIEVSSDEECIVVDYQDTGPGIEKSYLENDLIFEPGFSRKTEGGTGLGLPIAGEATKRNGGELKALYSYQGAHFIMEFPSAREESV